MRKIAQVRAEKMGGHACGQKGPEKILKKDGNTLYKVSSHDMLHARGLPTREKLRKLCQDATSAFYKEQEAN